MAREGGPPNSHRAKLGIGNPRLLGRPEKPGDDTLVYVHP
jgi:hypothetical protein